METSKTWLNACMHSSDLPKLNISWVHKPGFGLKSKLKCSYKRHKKHVSIKDNFTSLINLKHRPPVVRLTV